MQHSNAPRARRRFVTAVSRLFPLFICCLASLTPTQAQTVTGSGTNNRVPKFTSASKICDSAITESSGKVGIGIPVPTFNLDVNGQFGVRPSGSGYPTTLAGGLSGRFFASIPPIGVLCSPERRLTRATPT
ncbi:MAG TPA: hypothetical protein VM870_02715 [Pyrinomonadaceae bacterium]|jgi:hypothetical protein|nr:hypothetical protein [Pyrinomonadaceae bacterium]